MVRNNNWGTYVLTYGIIGDWHNALIDRAQLQRTLSGFILRREIQGPIQSDRINCKEANVSFEIRRSRYSWQSGRMSRIASTWLRNFSHIRMIAFKYGLLLNALQFCHFINWLQREKQTKEWSNTKNETKKKIQDEISGVRFLIPPRMQIFSRFWNFISSRL